MRENFSVIGAGGKRFGVSGQPWRLSTLCDVIRDMLSVRTAPSRGRLPFAVALVLALAAAGLVAVARPAQADPPPWAQRQLTVATYNVYLGADLTPLFTASSQEELARRAAAVYAQTEKTDFPSRAEAIAGVLAANPPDVVGLQEVARWKIGPVGGELETSYDFLELLLDALAEHGLDYRPVATNANFSGQLPIGPDTMASFADRDVIIARTDRPTARLHVSGAQSHTFSAELVIPTPAGPTFTVPRGWSAVDVKLRGKTVRVANTHLEAFDTQTRVAQAEELRAALENSPHPVVLAGDLNSLPEAGPDAYGMFTGAGYVDAWNAVHGPGGGFTAGQTADLDNFPSLLDHRVDYVLYQPRDPGVEAVAADVVDEEADDRTPAGRWPSDHAGVVTTVHIAHP